MPGEPAGIQATLATRLRALLDQSLQFGGIRSTVDLDRLTQSQPFVTTETELNAIAAPAKIATSVPVPRAMPTPA